MIDPTLPELLAATGTLLTVATASVGAMWKMIAERLERMEHKVSTVQTQVQSNGHGGEVSDGSWTIKDSVDWLREEVGAMRHDVTARLDAQRSDINAARDEIKAINKHIGRK